MIGQYEKMKAEERLENLALWDAMQKAQPMFLIMAMEISPVNAPLGSQ